MHSLPCIFTPILPTLPLPPPLPPPRARFNKGGFGYILLPTGSEERELFGFGGISVATLSSHQNMGVITLQLHNINIVG